MTVLEFIKMYNVNNYKYENKREWDIEISINKKDMFMKNLKI